jgi:hypothetical protein
MLDRICIGRQRILTADDPIDLGALAEALLFYGEVRVVADAGILMQLIRELAPGALQALLREGLLKLTYMDGNYAIASQNAGTPFELMQPLSFRSDAVSFDVVADREFARRTDSDSKSRKIRRNISPFVDLQAWDQSVVDAAMADLRSSDFVSSAVKSMVSAIAPDVPALTDTHFEITDTGDGFAVATNIDFQAINRANNHIIVSGEAPFTPAYMLTYLIECEAQLHRSAEYDAEIATDPLTSEVLSLKCDEVIFKASSSQQNIHQFQDRLLHGKSIRESINDRSRSFSDLIEVIVKARKFREWLDGEPDNADLLDAYYQEVTKDSWIAQLPGKTVKWAIFGAATTALAVAGIPVEESALAGLGLSAFDDFVVNKILKGWRPDQFVQGSLLPFVGED